MHSDQDGQESLLISSEAPADLSSKLLISDDRDGHCHDEAALNTNPEGLKPQPQADVQVEDNGLGEPGVLGEDIIPLSAPVAPHIQHHSQRPAPPSPIKAASPAQSHAPAGGDHVSPPELPLDRTPSNMIFSDLYRAPRTTFTKFRNSLPHAVPPPSDLDADLVSRDKARNKEAVKRYLAEKIRNDWEFTWPPVVASAAATTEPTTGAPQESARTTDDDATRDTTAPAAADEDASRDPGEEADSESDAESVYSTWSEDPARFRPRADWTSDLSDNEAPHPPCSPFRFDSPDAVGAAVRDSTESKRTRRRRAVRDETKWNPGLACFEARRDAWTGAKTVRMKPKPPSPVSPSSTRRLFWRHHRTQSSAVVSPSSPSTPTSPLHPIETRTSTTTNTSESDSNGVQRTTSQESNPPPPPPPPPHILYPVRTVLPLAPPLLPPQNPMRASVQPSMYGSLYDKVVVQSLQPSCPVNLADMLRACVVGWKRDGEWPPKSIYPAPAAVPVHAQNAEVLAVRQRKAQQQRSKNAAANSAGRRLSFVGFFNGGGGGGGGDGFGTKTVATATAQETTKDNKEGKDKEKENALGRSQSHSHSHSDEGGGSSGKALFRRSLQRVFSLGQHGHGHGHGAAAANGGGDANGGGGASTNTAGVSPSTKEVTAAG